LYDSGASTSATHAIHVGNAWLDHSGTAGCANHGPHPTLGDVDRRVPHGRAEHEHQQSREHAAQARGAGRQVLRRELVQRDREAVAGQQHDDRRQRHRVARDRPRQQVQQSRERSRERTREHVEHACDAIVLACEHRDPTDQEPDAARGDRVLRSAAEEHRGRPRRDRPRGQRRAAPVRQRLALLDHQASGRRGRVELLLDDVLDEFRQRGDAREVHEARLDAQQTQALVLERTERELQSRRRRERLQLHAERSAHARQRVLDAIRRHAVSMQRVREVGQERLGARGVGLRWRCGLHGRRPRRTTGTSGRSLLRRAGRKVATVRASVRPLVCRCRDASRTFRSRSAPRRNR
jgi:hypothetical protein